MNSTSQANDPVGTSQVTIQPGHVIQVCPFWIPEGAQIIQSGDGQVCMFQSVPFNCGGGNQIIGVKGFLVPSRAVTSTAGGGAPTPLNFDIPENKVEDVENKTMGQSTTQLATVEITCVNPKQYHRILKRRQERAKLVATGRIPKQRSKYLYESRHKHTVARARCGDCGRFYSTRNSNLTCHHCNTKKAVRSRQDVKLFL